MKQEKVILSFVAIIIGITFTGAAFYLYQNTKKVAPSNNIAVNSSPTPVLEKSSFYLIVNSPKNESISSKKSLTVSGKTAKNATVVILTSADQQVIEPSSQGDFSTTIQLKDGLNYIKIQSIAQNGEIQTVERVVGFTTEDF